MASPSSLSVSQPTTYADTLYPPPAFHSIPGQAPVVIGLHYKRGPPRDGRLNLVCLSLFVDVLSETSRLSRIRRKTKRTRLLVSSRPIQKGNRAISSSRTSSTFRLECHLVDYPGHVIRQPARSNEGLEKHLDENDEKEKEKKEAGKRKVGQWTRRRVAVDDRFSLSFPEITGVCVVYLTKGTIVLGRIVGRGNLVNVHTFVFQSGWAMYCFLSSSLLKKDDRAERRDS